MKAKSEGRRPSTAVRHGQSMHLQHQHTKSLVFGTRRLWMFPTTVALVRLQELARRAAGYSGPWTLSASAELTVNEARAAHRIGTAAALGQLFVVPDETRREILRTITQFCSQTRSIDGVMPLFISAWSAVIRSGGIDDARAAALQWDALASRTLVDSSSVPVADLHGRAVLLYDARALRRLRLSPFVDMAARGERGISGAVQPGGGADGSDFQQSADGSKAGNGLQPGGGFAPGDGLQPGGGFQPGEGLQPGGAFGAGTLGAGGAFGAGTLGAGGAFGAGTLGAGGAFGAGTLGAGGAFGAGTLGAGGAFGAGTLGGLVGGVGTLPGVGFGGGALQPGASEDGSGFCQGILTTAGASVGANLGMNLGALSGVEGGPPGMIGAGGLGAMAGYTFGKDVGSDMAKALCGGADSSGASGGATDSGGQLAPGTYVDPGSGLTYTVTGTGHTTSGDTSGTTTGDIGDIDQSLAPGTYTDPSSGYQYTVTSDGQTISGDATAAAAPSIGEVDDPTFVSGGTSGDKPQPDSTGGDKPQPDSTGGEKPNPDGNGPGKSGEQPNPDGSTGYQGPRGSSEKPAPDGGSGNPHSRGAATQLTTTFIEGDAVAANVVRVGASRYQLLNVPQIAINANGAPIVTSLGLLAARQDIVAAARAINAASA
jgi:hypothetical protein